MFNIAPIIIYAIILIVLMAVVVTRLPKAKILLLALIGTFIIWCVILLGYLVQWLATENRLDRAYTELNMNAALGSWTTYTVVILFFAIVYTLYRDYSPEQMVAQLTNSNQGEPQKPT
ncbi:MAG: hypothetical protein PHG23_03125 [Candidatus Pacebacteria bacterium]|nr:hypothetical protein [Candidatus Paceibacterota bacterium]